MQSGKDKVNQLKQSIQARKEAEDRRHEAGGRDLSPGLEAQYQARIAELEDALASALEQVKVHKEEAAKHQEEFLRKHAEFDNFRKRMEREKSEVTKYGHEKMTHELLPVLDSLEKAIEHADESHDFKDLMDGVQLVLKQFLQAMEKFGLVPLEAKGQPFDPNVHEAVAHHETDEIPPDHVVEVFRRGYALHNRLLRPSMVTVSKPSQDKKT